MKDQSSEKTTKAGERVGKVTFLEARHGEKSCPKWRSLNLLQTVFGLRAARTGTKVDESMQTRKMDTKEYGKMWTLRARIFSGNCVSSLLGLVSATGKSKAALMPQIGLCAKKALLCRACHLSFMARSKTGRPRRNKTNCGDVKTHSDVSFLYKYTHDTLRLYFFRNLCLITPWQGLCDWKARQP